MKELEPADLLIINLHAHFAPIEFSTEVIRQLNMCISHFSTIDGEVVEEKLHLCMHDKNILLKCLNLTKVIY